MSFLLWVCLWNKFVARNSRVRLIPRVRVKNDWWEKSKWYITDISELRTKNSRYENINIQASKKNTVVVAAASNNCLYEAYTQSKHNTHSRTQQRSHIAHIHFCNTSTRKLKLIYMKEQEEEERRQRRWWKKVKLARKHTLNHTHAHTYPMSYENKSEHVWFCVNSTNREAYIACHTNEIVEECVNKWATNGIEKVRTIVRLCLALATPYSLTCVWTIGFCSCVLLARSLAHPSACCTVRTQAVCTLIQCTHIWPIWRVRRLLDR